MLAGHKRNRHSRLGGFRHRRQLLLYRISTSALYAGEHLNSINCVRHSRITRRTPSPSLCSYGPVEMGAAPLIAAVHSDVLWPVGPDLPHQLAEAGLGAFTDCSLGFR